MGLIHRAGPSPHVSKPWTKPCRLDSNTGTLDPVACFVLVWVDQRKQPPSQIIACTGPRWWMEQLLAPVDFSTWWVLWALCCGLQPVSKTGVFS